MNKKNNEMKNLIYILLLCVTTTLYPQGNITVASGRTMTIDETGSLTVSGDFTNNGTVTLNSTSTAYSSIIVSGTATGEITYNRYVNTQGSDEWDLVGSPVEGLSIEDFANDNDGSLATNSSSYAIGSYDNSDDSWSNYTTASVTGGDEFEIGQGYQMAHDSGGTLAFTGDIASSAQSFQITNNADNGSGGRRWNLVANPFPSYLYGNENADGTHSFLVVNEEKMDENYLSMYGWDADGGGEYTVYNNLLSAVYVAPGQAFMIASDAASGENLSFTQDMRTTSGDDDFIENNPLNDIYEVLLRLYHGNQKIKETRLCFKESLSLGLDPGYDAGDYNENAALMTRLVEGDQGIGFVINAMSTLDMSDVVVPLVINQDAGQEFRVNLHTSTIGEVNIYLEDNQAQTMTLLNEEDFVLTPTSDLEGAGRFYIHLTADTLSNGEVNTSILNAYKEVDENYITIEGLSTQSTSTQVSLFNILGTKVIGTTLDNTSNTQMISTNGLSTGIYVIKLESGQNQLTKKLIIK